jgi:hypothetical protein
LPEETMAGEEKEDEPLITQSRCGVRAMQRLHAEAGYGLTTNESIIDSQEEVIGGGS